MKKLLTILAVTIWACGLPVFAATPSPAKPAKPATPAPSKVVGEAKTIPMYSRADVIDTKARTFTTKRKDGVEVKLVLTPTTEIKQGESPAKLEDIKVGDYVSGSRKKVSETEYTVVKITKFGPKADKKETPAKPAADAKSN
jgi:hypothetical protein